MGGVCIWEGEKAVGRWQPCNVIACLEAEFGNKKTDWGNGDHVVEWLDGCRLKGATKSSDCIILGNLEDLYQGLRQVM